MRRSAKIVSTVLVASMMLTGCSWGEIKDKFTGADSGVEEAADYVAEDCITIAEYKGVEVDCSVGDDEVKAEIDSFLGQNTTEKKIKKGKCKAGDTVNIDYSGSIDGKKFDGGTAEDQSLELGSNSFIPGFEDQVIGMSVGDKKDINVKFPDDYHDDKVAGKDAVFSVKVNYISESIVPELTDKLVKEKTEYKTVDEYKKGTLEKLKKDKEEDAGSSAYNIVQEKTEVKNYPDSLISGIKKQIDAYYRYMAKQYQFEDFNKFLEQSGMTEDAYNEQLKKAAENVAKSQLIAEVICAKENITVTDEEVDNAIKEAAEQGQQSVEDFEKAFKEAYGDSITIKQYHKNMLITNKAGDFVKDNAVIKK